MSDDYDRLYDLAVHHMLFTHYDEYGYRTDKLLKDFIDKECKGKRSWDRQISARDITKSKIASDTGYQSFLKKAGMTSKDCDWIVEKWSTGGKEGGNCWNDNAPTHYTSEENGPENIMAETLTKVAPQVTFLQYLVLQKILKHESYIKGEYYGNSTDYKSVGFCLYHLYIALKDMGHA